MMRLVALHQWKTVRGRSPFQHPRVFGIAQHIKHPISTTPSTRLKAFGCWAALRRPMERKSAHRSYVANATADTRRIAERPDGGANGHAAALQKTHSRITKFAFAMRRTPTYQDNAFQASSP
jgi:hypothetical protein